MTGNLVSIIVPVYNEAAHIEALIGSLKALKAECEIIFVDGGSTDGTVETVQNHFAILRSAQKGRALQMNCGAENAKGSVLFFVHADSLIEGNALYEIQRAIAAGYKAGCFRIRFDSESPLMAVCGFMSNLRVKWRGIAFGDQGIFIEKDYFFRLGGFKPILLMEDYQLSMDIKNDGQKIVLADALIITSERRFLKLGRLKTMWLMQKLQRMYRKGADIETIAKMYK